MRVTVSDHHINKKLRINNARQNNLNVDVAIINKSGMITIRHFTYTIAVSISCLKYYASQTEIT